MLNSNTFITFQLLRQGPELGCCPGDAPVPTDPFSLCRLYRSDIRQGATLPDVNFNQEMRFYHTNCGFVTSYNLPLGMWVSPGIGQTHPDISDIPCRQPMLSLWMRCYLHPSRVTFNPKCTMMKHLSCQKGCVYPRSPQQNFSTSFPATSTALTLWAASPGQAALQSGLCLLKSLGQHIEGLSTQQCLC